MELNLADLKGGELSALEHTVRHFEPDHLRSKPAYELGLALKAEIRARVGRTIAGKAGTTSGDGRGWPC
jgi:hypothetical protein